MEYIQSKELVIDEINVALGTVDPQEIDQLVKLILSSEKVFVVGVGRVLLMLQAFVKRLNHIGINANFVGAIDEPAITQDDLLIVGSGSGESVIPVAIAKVAKKYNAKIVHIGSNAQSSVGAYADLFVRIPCKTKLNLPDEIQSRQPMSSLFEQGLLLLLDIVAMMIVERKGIDIPSLWKQHANLE